MFHHSIAAEHRFFFALQPPIRLARQLVHAAHWFRDTGRAVAADRMHVTMFILPDQFERSTDLIGRLKAAGAAVACGPVDVLMDYVSAGAQSIALRPQHKIAGLAALHDELAARCRGAGIEGRPDYAFAPHITLGYRPGRPFGQRVAPVAWTATEFVLIHSHLGRTKHTPLGRWPLVAREEQLALL